MNKETYWQIFDKYEFNSAEDQQHYYQSLSKIDYDKAVKGTGREDQYRYMFNAKNNKYSTKNAV